jgi:hypothetical protein
MMGAAQVVQPIVAAFRPDLIIVSAGFDAAEGDPLGGMSLSPAGIPIITGASWAPPRIVFDDYGCVPVAEVHRCLLLQLVSCTQS